MTTHLIVTWFLVIGLVVIGILARCIVRFKKTTNNYRVGGFEGKEDFFEYDDDDNDDENYK